MALTSTETGTDGRNVFTEEYQDFGLKSLLTFKWRYQGGNGIYKSRAQKTGLDQHCTVNLCVLMEMFFICAVQFHSH